MINSIGNQDLHFFEDLEKKYFKNAKDKGQSNMQSYTDKSNQENLSPNQYSQSFNQEQSNY